MKNKVEELVIILSEVKNSLELKEKTLTSTSMMNNVKKKIKALESDAKEIEDRYSNKPEVFLNFRRRAGEIMEEIEALK
ncbi:MAG: hypothetical protein JKX68_01450 [Flavobacteriales bacterium]|nr:hypothetical protein [Flavobacteriales bacterium]